MYVSVFMVSSMAVCTSSKAGYKSYICPEKEKEMKLSLSKRELQNYTMKQLKNFFPDNHPLKGDDIDASFEQALERTENCFRYIKNAAYSDGQGTTFFSHLHSDQYATFLYYWANSLWKLSANKSVCDKLIYLNKTLHGFFVSYKGKLPDIFFLTHPVGSVIGNAAYSDFLVIGQNVTINTGENSVGVTVPKLGKGLYLAAGAKIIGNDPVGNRVSIGVDAFVYEEPVPDDSIVLRKPDGSVQIRRRKKEFCKAQQYFNVKF